MSAADDWGELRRFVLSSLEKIEKRQDRCEERMGAAVEDLERRLGYHLEWGQDTRLALTREIAATRSELTREVSSLRARLLVLSSSGGGAAGAGIATALHLLGIF